MKFRTQKMKKNIYINTIVVLMMIVFASACKKDVPPGGTSVQDMAGDWYIKVNNTGDYFSVLTFNTSANSSTEMWVQTSAALVSGTTSIAVKGKVPVELGAKTFSGTNIANIAATKTTIPTFSIANGKVVPNGTEGPVSKSPADLISFDLIVNGVTYKIEGYHKTGYLEDIPE